jgi:hypothetical protein
MPWSALFVGTQVAAVGSSDLVAGVWWQHRMAKAVGRGVDGDGDGDATCRRVVRVCELADFVTSQHRVWMSRDFGSKTFGRSGGRSRGRANVHGVTSSLGRSGWSVLDVSAGGLQGFGSAIAGVSNG